MENNLSLIETFDVVRELKTPHLLYRDINIYKEQKIAFSVLARKAEEILLINSSGFGVAAVLAGLTAEHIEFLVKNAPSEYRQEIWSSISADYKIQEIFEIAKAMDEDLGENVTQNQARVKSVIQYIRDNQIAFEF